MPRYFFDTDDTGTVSRDELGRELDHLDAARLEAIAAAHDMARERKPLGEWASWMCKVRGEDGTVLYSVSVTFIGRWG